MNKKANISVLKPVYDNEFEQKVFNSLKNKNFIAIVYDEANDKYVEYVNNMTDMEIVYAANSLIQKHMLELVHYDIAE